MRKEHASLAQDAEDAYIPAPNPNYHLELAQFHTGSCVKMILASMSPRASYPPPSVVVPQWLCLWHCVKTVLVLFFG